MVMAVVSSLAAPQAAFKDWASKLPNLMELVTGDEMLKEYTFLFENINPINFKVVNIVFCIT